MKTISMKIPVLQQLYNQKQYKWINKYSKYQKHKKKLEKIYQQRKSQLSIDDHRRIVNIDNIKQCKTKSFIYKFNQQSNNIAKQNLKLLGKLQTIKTSIKLEASPSLQKKKQRNTMTPFIKKQIQKTEQENWRIVKKLRNLSSNLDNRLFVKDYVKSQKIKNRLMKYGNNNSRVFLKSGLYLSEIQFRKTTGKDTFRKTVGNFNKNRTNCLVQQKRSTTSIHNLNHDNQEQNNKFFTTQPRKSKGIKINYIS